MVPPTEPDAVTATPAAEQQLTRSADAVADSTRDLSDSADRRTTLAADRTMFAAERTYAAWMRTGLAALAGGVGARALLAGMMPRIMQQVTASVLVAFAGICFIAAVWRELQGLPPPPRTSAKPFPRGLLLPFNAFLMLVVAAVLVGLWAAD